MINILKSLSIPEKIYLLLEERKPPKKFIKGWIKMLSKYDSSCPCIHQGYIEKSKQKKKCPLGYKNMGNCLGCRLSVLWQHYKHIYEIAPVLIEKLGILLN